MEDGRERDPLTGYGISGPLRGRTFPAGAWLLPTCTGGLARVEELGELAWMRQEPLEPPPSFLPYCFQACAILGTKPTFFDQLFSSYCSGLGLSSLSDLN